MEIHICAGSILAVDPGRSKTGLAVVELAGDDVKNLWREVVPTESVVEKAVQVSARYSPVCIVIGDRTTSVQMKQLLDVLGLPVYTVDEHMSSMEARKRYFELYPPRGLGKLIPVTMKTPPVPVDDLVAVILGERFARLITAQPSDKP